MPATLPSNPIQNSETRPFSKLQCTVNGAQAILRTMSFLQFAIHSASSCAVTASPFVPSVLPFSTAALLDRFEDSRYRRTKFSATCVIQNRELHNQARPCLSALQPKTPLEDRYAPFSRYWKKMPASTWAYAICLRTTSSGGACSVLFPHFQIPISPHRRVKVRKSETRVARALNRPAAIKRREEGIVEVSRMTVVLGGREAALSMNSRAA